MAREKTYSQDVEAAVNAGAVLGDTTLEKKGADKKTYTQPSKTLTITSLSQWLAFCGNDETEAWGLVTKRIVNPMVQANDYRKLTVLAEGPEKAIKDTVETLVDNKMFDSVAEAIEFTITKMQKNGALPSPFTYGEVTFGA